MQLVDQNWAKAFAKQALSDLNTREVLVGASAEMDGGQVHVEKCHRLHFLQMAAEKTCKAHLTLQNGHENVRDIHCVIKKNLPAIARHFYAVLGIDRRIAQGEIGVVKRLAAEIEVLAPACEHGGARPDNTEYPWEDSTGRVYTPSDYTFPNIDDGPESRTIPRLVRLIRTAAESFSR